MKFKYFQITEKETIDHIESCLDSILTREARLAELAKHFGALDCLCFNGGSIAAFKFSYTSRPDKSIWKKVKHGFMPKVKTNENKMLLDIPKSTNYRDIIKKYSFGGEMIIGEPTHSGSGFPMHSSGLMGNRKNRFWAIKAPYTGEFDRKVDGSLTELKEWEVTKGCDSSENT